MTTNGDAHAEKEQLRAELFAEMSLDLEEADLNSGMATKLMSMGSARDSLAPVATVHAILAVAHQIEALRLQLRINAETL